MSDTLSKLLLTIADTGPTIGVGRTKVYELIDAGELETVNIGRRRLVVAESVDQYVKRLRGGAE